MRYLCNHLIDFDEVCMAMHIRRSDPTGDQKFDNLTILKSKIVDRGHLKNRKSYISYLQWRYEINFSNKTANINGKNFPVYNQV